jgi:cytochrome d ubiquinol oxidase subunit I
MLFIGIYGSWQFWRGAIERRRWFLKLVFFSGPLGFAAVIAGWITAEVGRQPYTVYGLLRTVDSVSPVTAGAVGTSLIVFIFAYGIVFTAGSWYLFRLAWAGPRDREEAEADKPRLASWFSAAPTNKGDNTSPAQAGS